MPEHQSLDGGSHNLPCELRDYPQWHRGRPRYALWAIDVRLPSILERMRHARALLGDWLHPAYQRQAHITLFVCGFPSQDAEHDDDIAMARLAAQHQALRQLAMAPFELQIGGLDSFASAPFLRVADPQQRLAALRAALAAIHPEVRQAAYLPHLTLGLYRRRFDRDAWLARSAALADCPPLSLAVEQLQLLSYRASEPYGRLRTDTRLILAH